MSSGIRDRRERKRREKKRGGNAVRRISKCTEREREREREKRKVVKNGSAGASFRRPIGPGDNVQNEKTRQGWVIGG